LNTNSFEQIYDWGYDPADSTEKECALGTPGVAVARNSNDFVGSNDAEVLGALPAGYALDYVLRGADGHVGIFSVGHIMDGDDRGLARTAVRFYRYYAPDTSLGNWGYVGNQGDDESCSQSTKLLEFAVPGLTSSRYQFFPSGNCYNFLDYTPALDCCFGQTDYPGSHAALVGKWWRFEAVFINRDGPGFDTKLWVRNVTDDEPEVLYWDLADSPAVGVTPPGRVESFEANNYRQGGSDANTPCSGSYAISHFMVAGWDTDEGQRIGPAAEIEGMTRGQGGSPGATSATSSTSASSGAGNGNGSGSGGNAATSDADGASAGGCACRATAHRERWGFAGWLVAIGLFAMLGRRRRT
jgi:MYXO-CTERM domain-containing protein